MVDREPGADLHPMTGRRLFAPHVAAVVLVLGALLATACGSSSANGSSTEPAAARPSTTEASGCATAHPATWMGCLVRVDPAFGTLPISGLALPGAHNAGTFNLDPQSFDTQQGSACTEFVPQDATLGTVFARWFETQDESITEQLDQGVRFIDLQVAYNGDGSAQRGWRVVQSQFSQWPLYDYLDQVAAWAKRHPSEAVVVDFRNICYDNRPGPAIAAGLFSNFATPSDVGGGTTTLAEVAFDAGEPSRSFATTTVDQVVQQGGGGHNVVVLLPRDVEDAATLTTRYRVRPVFTVEAGADAKASSTALPVAFPVAAVAPTASSMFAAANSQLASYPTHATPAFGSLVGHGLYEVQLAYSFDPGEQSPLFATFGGLIQSAPASTPGTAPATLPPWEAGLWDPNGAGAVSRNRILVTWGHRANVVLADGVENRGYVAAVIGLNAR